MIDRLRDATISRRKFVLGSAGAVAAAGTTGNLSMPQTAEARRPPLPAPKPIPGGLRLADGSIIHVLPPGPDGMVLPHTGLQLIGFDVEPSTMTDIKGLSARAYVIGKAAGSDGKEYDLEVDIAPFTGTYVAEDGSQREGTFASI